MTATLSCTIAQTVAPKGPLAHMFMYKLHISFFTYVYVQITYYWSIFSRLDLHAHRDLQKHQ